MAKYHEHLSRVLITQTEEAFLHLKNINVKPILGHYIHKLILLYHQDIIVKTTKNSASSPEKLFFSSSSYSKVTAILLKGWILPLGGTSLGEGLRLQPAQQACLKKELL